MYAPSAVGVSADGTVYVADAYNDRILVFEPPLQSGMSATCTSGAHLDNLNSVEIDPDGRGIWIQNQIHWTVELWDWSGTEVMAVLGRRSYEPGGQSETGWRSSGGMGIDTAGNVLISEPVYGHDVFRFPPQICRALAEASQFQTNLFSFHPRDQT